MKQSGFGQPEISAFRGGRSAAISLQFDDSMISQVKNALPLLKERGLAATFFVNPGVNHYAANRAVWEGDILKAGHELGNHTFTHKGANNADEAEREIRGCYDVLARVYGSRPRLLPFAQPGGVPWNVPPDEQNRLFTKYLLFPTPNRAMFADGQGDLRAIAERALHERSWVQVGMHGVGDEWISTSVPNLTRLLDYLIERRAEILTAPTGAVYKYTQERAAARPLTLTDVSDHGFTVKIECDESKINRFGKSFAVLYDEPLTVRVPVPKLWRKFMVKQGVPAAPHETFDVQGQTIAQFNVLPNGASARIMRI